MLAWELVVEAEALRKQGWTISAIARHLGVTRVTVRQYLSGERTPLDHGPATIAWHLHHHHGLTVSINTIHRHLTAAGLIIAQPHKRPKSSYIRFAAEQPNECWQADFTHWWLADDTHVEILNWLDDHARYALSVTAHRRVTGPIVLAEFRKACATHGIPASTLTDNGMVFTTRLSGGKGGRNHLEHELHRLGVTQINSTPGHPTTCGKVERFHQTLKKWLAAQSRASTLTELQTQLDAFVDEYNHHRPHRGMPHQATPATAYTTRPKAQPSNRTDTHNRVRTDRIDQFGKLTLRHAGRLHHIGVGPNPRPHPRPSPRPGSRHPDHQRRHGRTTPPAIAGPDQGLPTPRHPNRPPKKEARTLKRGFGLFRCPETSQLWS
jgi:transposase InsO family protein